MSRRPAYLSFAITPNALGKSRNVFLAVVAIGIAVALRLVERQMIGKCPSTRVTLRFA